MFSSYQEEYDTYCMLVLLTDAEFLIRSGDLQTKPSEIPPLFYPQNVVLPPSDIRHALAHLIIMIGKFTERCSLSLTSICSHISHSHWTA